MSDSLICACCEWIRQIWQEELPTAVRCWCETWWQNSDSVTAQTQRRATANICQRLFPWECSLPERSHQCFFGLVALKPDSNESRGEGNSFLVYFWPRCRNNSTPTPNAGWSRAAESFLLGHGALLLSFIYTLLTPSLFCECTVKQLHES